MTHRDRKKISLYMTKQEKSQLDNYAEILGISRQKLLEAIIATTLEDLDVMDKIDFLMSEVRLIDQLNMFKKLTPQEIDEIAKNHITRDEE